MMMMMLFLAFLLPPVLFLRFFYFLRIRSSSRLSVSFPASQGLNHQNLRSISRLSSAMIIRSLSLSLLSTPLPSPPLPLFSFFSLLSFPTSATPLMEREFYIFRVTHSLFPFLYLLI
ncbi:hypothetical protein F4775DRAFT_272403 [Biscogniauxia sp. FL1348]|nr:hypothetical protein F4775DRAFT_272403 [Biscogniauxia sp. FL1348]